MAAPERYLAAGDRESAASFSVEICVAARRCDLETEPDHHTSTRAGAGVFADLEASRGLAGFLRLFNGGCIIVGFSRLFTAQRELSNPAYAFDFHPFVKGTRPVGVMYFVLSAFCLEHLGGIPGSAPENLDLVADNVVLRLSKGLRIRSDRDPRGHYRDTNEM